MSSQISLPRRAAVGLTLAAACTTAAAPDDPGIVALTRLFNARTAKAEWFTPNFLAHASIGEAQSLLDQIRQQYGMFKGASSTGTSFTVHLQRADMPARVALDDKGRFSGLRLLPAVPTQGSLQDLAHDIAGLPGKTSVLITSDGKTIVDHGGDTDLAVGSAFKLAVLAALATACQRGQLAWEQVVRLDPAWYSLPSGSLQDWPAGTPLTLATLANMMISVSDNTAADALIAILGRDALDSLSPNNAPFLTTREAFKLKAVENTGLHAKFIAGDVAAKRALLPAIDALSLPAAAAAERSTARDIEWFFSARAIAALLERVGILPMFDINPGVARRADWRHIAFKGGSDIGVLNLSTLVTGKGGVRHCVITTWNNPGGVDSARLGGLYAGLLDRLGRGQG